MSKMRFEDSANTSPYHAKLEQWTSKEVQLNVLHEEIINKREALLRSSRNFLQGFALDDLPLSDTDAAIRNDKLMRDISSLQDTLTDQLTDQRSPRFANLQANYWSMVKNMFPIWERSLRESAAKDV